MDYTVILTYGFLLLTVFLIWFKFKLFGKYPLWVALLSVALIIAVIFKYIGIVSFIYAIIFGVVMLLYYKTKNIILYILSLAMCIPLFLHLPFTEFNNYQFLNAVKITGNATPYSLYFNFDKTLIAIFLIGFGCSITKIDFVALLRKVLWYLLLMFITLLIIALILGYTKFEPKIPAFTPIWILVNLFFVCTAEEALFRRLIQDKIEKSFRYKYSYVAGILISSLLFGLAHFKGGIAYITLAFIAGLFYAYIYYKTKKIESSILLHFSFNLVHFIFFTYPSLSS